MCWQQSDQWQQRESNNQVVPRLRRCLPQHMRYCYYNSQDIVELFEGRRIYLLQQKSCHEELAMSNLDLER